MLRLDPAHPPLWRDATTLQFGLDPVAIVDAPEAWQERLVRELEHGVAPAALEPVGIAIGAAPGEPTSFVRRISRALASAPAGPASRAVVVQAADGVDRSVTAAVMQALATAGFESAPTPTSPTDGEPTPIVMLAQHLVEPRRAAIAIGRDLPHLPVVFRGADVEIGPYVRPGVSACLACVAADRIDADPAWPQLAAQMLGRPAPHVTTAVAWEAGLAAARMLTDAARHPARQATRSLRLRVATGALTVRRHRPHAACRCRSLGGIATAPVREVPATTTARAYARPA